MYCFYGSSLVCETMSSSKLRILVERHATAACWTVLCVLLCYAHAAMADAARTIPTGTWGGDHVFLEVTESGAELEFDCAHGHIDEPLRVDVHGRFDVNGTFTPEHPGPVRRDESALQSKTRYVGRVAGETMVLTVVRNEKELGSFSLVHGTRPRLKKCR